MAADTASDWERSSQIHLAHGDEMADFVIALDGKFSGGDLIHFTADFTGGIEGKGDIASKYELSNWLSGMTSGAFYAFRVLKAPKRRVLLSRLCGFLQASSMTALANATTTGVIKLMSGEVPKLELDGWRIDCEVVSRHNTTHQSDSSGTDSRPGGEFQAGNATPHVLQHQHIRLLDLDTDHLLAIVEFDDCWAEDRKSALRLQEIRDIAVARLESGDEHASKLLKAVDARLGRF